MTPLNTVPARSLTSFAIKSRQASCLTYSGQDDVLDVAHAVGLVDALLYLCTGNRHHLHSQRRSLQNNICDSYNFYLMAIILLI